MPHTLGKSIVTESSEAIDSLANPSEALPVRFAGIRIRVFSPKNCARRECRDSELKDNIDLSIKPNRTFTKGSLDSSVCVSVSENITHNKGQPTMYFGYIKAQDVCVGSDVAKEPEGLFFIRSEISQAFLSEPQSRSVGAIPQLESSVDNKSLGVSCGVLGFRTHKQLAYLGLASVEIDPTDVPATDHERDTRTCRVVATGTKVEGPSSRLENR
jgi:hypothetical protein